MTYTPAFIAWSLGRWANEMYVRFGGHGVKVYLVGSALHSEHHKDVDVSIVLPDEVFKDRYGMLESEWLAEQTRFEDNKGVLKVTEWAPAHVRWAKEVGGLVPALAKLTTEMGPPDLKVMSESWQQACAHDKPRMRLDTVEGDE